MKSKLLLYFACSMLFGLLFSVGVHAQINLDDYKIIYKFSTLKQADNTRLLEVSFVARNNEDKLDILPVYDAEIFFYNEGDSTDVKIGSAKTDQTGFAHFTIPANYKYITDAAGYINLKARFKGTDGIPAKTKSVAVKDLFLTLVCEEIDSVKTVTLRAVALDSTLNKAPVPELDVVFSVGAMLSRLPIAEETLEDGEFEFAFEEKIPGDKKGNLEVYAFVDDHEEYGTVLVSAKTNWGTPNNQVLAKQNTLWSDVAPIWMYVVLTILLLGVWANYVYSAWHLLKISKEGKALQSTSTKKN